MTDIATNVSTSQEQFILKLSIKISLLWTWICTKGRLINWVLQNVSILIGQPGTVHIWDWLTELKSFISLPVCCSMPLTLEPFLGCSNRHKKFFVWNKSKLNAIKLTLQEAGGGVKLSTRYNGGFEN